MFHALRSPILKRTGAMLTSSTPYGGVESLYAVQKTSLERISYKDPYDIFSWWYKDANDSPEIVNPSVMCLATATATGIPSVRYMMCESHNSDGFIFSTHHCSRKGQELVRIEGDIEQLPNEECDKRFESRPYTIQIDLHSSSQKHPIESVSVIARREKKIREMYDPAKVPRPQNFCWYILRPTFMEFWQLFEGKERMRFRRPREGETPDNILTHQGSAGWVYELMEP